MAYSTITKKKCKQGGCHSSPKLGFDGYCYPHAPEEIKERQKSKTRKQIKQARQRLQNKIAALRPVDMELTEQQLWFKSMAYELAKNPFCQECGAFIPEMFYRSATAHVMPKRKEFGFPSIATHPANKLFVGGGCGCHNKTHTWSLFVTMKVWPIAVAIFIEVYPYIAEEEKKNIPDVLREYIPLCSQSA